MAKLLTVKEYEKLPNGTRLKIITGKVIIKGKDRVNKSDLKFGLLPISLAPRTRRKSRKSKRKSNRKK